MADQRLPPARLPGGISNANGLSRAPTRAVTGPATASTTNNVRRNLFQSQLTRRPPPSSASSTSAETLRLDGESASRMVLGGAADARSESSEIVIRDVNGEVELGDPPTPPVDDTDEVALDSRQENEKERQRLAEAVKQHRIDQSTLPAQPEELLEAVRASLRAKVAALAEDNWMYEPEGPIRHA